MKFKQILSVLVFSSSALYSMSSANAGIWEDYLAHVEGQFDRAKTPQKKYEIISEPVNSEYIRSLESISDFNPMYRRKEVGARALSYMSNEGEELLNWDKATALTLAISLGKVDAVRKFLDVVPDVNADKLTGWGYRQPYYPAHFALHPAYPSPEKPDQKAQLEIIDMLAAKGANFNKIYNHSLIGIYTNPPLSAGDPSGCVSYKNIQPLRARALLYGANPALMGSSFNGFDLKGNGIFYPVTKYAFQYYCEVVKDKGLAAVRPVPAVMNVIKEYANSIRFDLADFQTSANAKESRSVKLNTQIATLDAEISKFGAQKTKKAHAKVRHLENVKAELERDLKKASKVLNRFKVPAYSL